MAESYDLLVGKVRDWVNRDADTLPNTIIFDALDYAADTIYRELRIPVLEASFQYDPDTVVSSGSSDSLLATLPFTLPDNTSAIPIPQDLSEFIQIKISGVAGQSGGLTRPGADIVINEKADLRTFEDFYSERYDYYVWTRKGEHILFRPALSGSDSRIDGATIELYYYRRLPDLDARYDVAGTTGLANANEGFVLEVSDTNPAPTDLRTGNAVTTRALFSRATTDPATPLYYAANNNDDTRTSVTVYGAEAPNWLRDQNEKALLFGALHQCFDYLGEDQMSAKYLQKAVAEVSQLNAEEGQRRNSGGNQQVNFNGLNMI